MAKIARNLSRLILFAGAFVLVIGSVFQFVRLRDLAGGDVRSGRAIGFLKNRLPTNVEGWQSLEEPLGATEAVRGAVESMLNFDDYYYRIFTRGDTHIGVYVAYWKRDRMPVSRVATHTPDRCWTENGWTCEAMKFNEVWQSPKTGVFQPAQWRIFVSPGNSRENVVFWHLVNGKAFDFGERFTLFTHPGKWLRDTLTYAVLGSGEQYFIRLTSNRPFEEFAGDTGWNEMLLALGQLGLSADRLGAVQGVK